MAFAAGVVCGSVMWGLAAALGLSTLMRTYSWTLVALKIAGGLYLLFLSWNAARAASARDIPEPGKGAGMESRRRAFTSGLGMHVTNPKAIFVWLSIVTLALPSGASREHALGVVASCAVIGVFVFFGYALAFSTAVARALYSKAHRWFNATLSAVFAFAGVKLFFVTQCCLTRRCTRLPAAGVARLRPPVNSDVRARPSGRPGDQLTSNSSSWSNVSDIPSYAPEAIPASAASFDG